MSEQSNSILDKTIRRLLPLWRDVTSGRRSIDKLPLHPELNAQDSTELKNWMDACLSDQGGEIAARARAATLGRSFLELNEEGRIRFLSLLSDHYGTDDDHVSEIIQHWKICKGAERISCANALRSALEPARMKLLTQFNELPEGIKFLVDMRAELLGLLSKNPNLKPLEHDLKRLLSSWFDIGLLQLERITWQSSAELLEKLIAYEAVHEIKSWNDLKNRLDSDRRCFAFFHPSMPNEPLIFVEVALVNGLSDNVQHLLDENAPVQDISQADTAIFYSISNAQKGLAGISFGNFLIKRVVKLLQAEFPQLTQFSTLSPIPGFCRWLKNSTQDPLVTQLLAPEREWLEPAIASGFNNIKLKQAHKDSLQNLALYYLAKAHKENKKNPNAAIALDPVAHFHLSNGAKIERLNWMADSSVNGLKQSAGMMVNYLYELPKIESNSRQYSEKGERSLSIGVKKQLKSNRIKQAIPSEA
ncbi:malonyl-CoA decarboxylase [Oceanospirillum multiglobuliferum]|uniref:Malonyl-CoA decarboxylase n=1 Tax=Oceanospirillum multiglobuliferum TaxID=64969 RepID=A0A1T4KF85_9GAMM|nr:malonyl-CoA decarboxylase [Oceanospirillum multiglobuliferum]OPX56010.1 malonyl-CoA decarboxylase [Oceanospirillum multiglobuliferum]SJZ41036.1 malonyl-CoA decarboxylase [Oceanospirillum multiglobuliferum]